MTKPRFANTTISSSRRPKRDTASHQVVTDPARPLAGATHDQNNDHIHTEKSKSITDFMEQQKRVMRKEPTRPITLRFEESLWQQVEALRGPLSKNDFFKYLVDFYIDQQQENA